MRSSYLFKVCITLSFSALAFYQHSSDCSAQSSSCDMPGAVTATFGDGAQQIDEVSSGCGCESGCGGQGACGCEQDGRLFGRGRLRSSLTGRSNGAGSDCGCEDNGSLRSRLFLNDPIARGPASGISLNRRGVNCDRGFQGCEECKGGLFSGLGSGRVKNSMAGRGSSLGGRLRGGLAGCESCGGDDCMDCSSGLGNGALASRFQGGGLLGGNGMWGGLRDGSGMSGGGLLGGNGMRSGLRGDNGMSGGGLLGGNGMRSGLRGGNRMSGGGLLAGNGMRSGLRVGNGMSGGGLFGGGSMDSGCTSCGDMGSGLLGGQFMGGHGLGNGQLACGGCGLSGCHACGAGLFGRGLAKGMVGPARGEIPHTSQPPMGYGDGQQAPTYGYPYYTSRAPRDFLMDNPPSIGW